MENEVHLAMVQICLLECKYQSKIPTEKEADI
jgi:hypothetical protein